jgi:hypothetical protein
MRTVAKILGAVAALLILFLLVGLVLPGSWTAEESVVIDAPPAEVFPWVNSVSRWEAWTNPWPEGQSKGPDEGVGAVRSWNDPVFGTGSFTITRSEPPRTVGYEVLVEGSMRWEGRLELAALPRAGADAAAPAGGLGGRTRVTWSESGDFGRNPLMGYMARMMRTSQGEELARGLDRLRELVEGGSDTTPPT